MMPYIDYDSQWNRIGYRDAPRYKGQPEIACDFPLACPQCGGTIAGVGVPVWLSFRGIGPMVAQNASGGYVAWCEKMHTIEMIAIDTLSGVCYGANR